MLDAHVNASRLIDGSPCVHKKWIELETTSYKHVQQELMIDPNYSLLNDQQSRTHKRQFIEHANDIY